MNKLIFVEGIPGCGKSTNSQFIANQLEENGYNVEWIHEGVEDHPLWEERNDYFNDDGYVNEEYFDIYTDSLIDKFKKLEVDIIGNDKVYVIDGAIFSGFVNVYYKSDCYEEKTRQYFNKIEKALKNLNPLLIYLSTDRVREHTIETWENRAMWGKKVVINSYGKIPHVKRGGYEGDDILYAYINPLHQQNLDYFKVSKFEKLLFCIDKREYDKYHKEILNHLSLNLVEYPKDMNKLEKYIGIYDNDRDEKNMFVKIVNNQLVCDWGEMNMLLQYVKPYTYNLRSYPIYLEFIEEDNKIIGINTYGRQCFRRAGCSFKRVGKTKYKIRK